MAGEVRTLRLHAGPREAPGLGGRVGSGTRCAEDTCEGKLSLRAALVAAVQAALDTRPEAGRSRHELLQTAAMHHAGTQTEVKSALGARVPAAFYYAWRFI